MKHFFLLLTSLIISVSALAGNGVEREDFDYSKAGDLPVDVRQRIEKVLLEKCSSMVEFSRYTSVDLISVEREKIDQGIIDYTYKVYTTFVDRDNYANLGTSEIIIKHWAISNPAVDNIEILKLDLTNSCN